MFIPQMKAAVGSDTRRFSPNCHAAAPSGRGYAACGRRHMLELRPNCECCDRDLAPSNADVFICTFECTWCADCVATFPGRACPNCGGNLERRPVRPSHLLATHPASTVRVTSPDCRERFRAVIP
ncbi:DUF1272 domain-containing protein [Sinomonas sp. JGH33]|uniref:DUF1272 domain-containing protein n=1 Tax=Sinomonas terricola TaxID=3110330 RepID=A0ABU5T8C7_9MICC|nr:DUF1272 domain-containing protein [Sinomonas sp. JGH33]MEA5455772.1 DUF1272 domain-containing protein [Sinomonas sp. JGH33]